jgi:threonine dehydrogenase-like Zn-dependent dehydrogenase
MRGARPTQASSRHSQQPVSRELSARRTPTLLRLVASHQIEAAQFATHHFKLHEMIEAYDVSARAADTGAIKVVLAR